MSQTNKIPFLAVNWKVGILGFAIGLTLPIISLIIDLSVNDMYPTMAAIRVLHGLNPEHWIIDLAPLVIGSLAYFYSTRVRYLFDKQLALIKHQADNVSKLAIFAEKIGNGDFDAEYVVSDNSDSLGRALLEMRAKLKQNKDEVENKNWIAIGRDRIATLLRENSSMEELSYQVIRELINYTGVVQGAIYLTHGEGKETMLKMAASHAYNRKKYLNAEFPLGHGLVGEAAIEQDIVHRTEIPDNYLTVTSGLLGDRKPRGLLIVPLISEEKLQGAIELAGFDRFTDLQIEFVKELALIIARTFFNLKTNERTQMLLEESQSMTSELQEQQIQLEQNAIEMEAKQEEIEKTNQKLEEQITEVKNSHMRQHNLLEKSSEIITIYNKNAEIKYESPSIKSILGYDPEELIGTNDFGFTQAEGNEDLQTLFDRLIENPGESGKIAYAYRKKNGENILMEAEARNLLDDPAINGIVFNSRDITQRRKAEREQIMRGKMQALSENSPDIILRFDIRGSFLYTNPMLEAYTGISSEKFQDATYHEVDGIEPVVKDGWTEIITEVQNTRDVVNKEMIFPTSSQELVMQVNAIPEFENGELETVLVVSHDITERKTQELLIRNTNKKITDSISYARRLQSAIVPDTSYIREELPESFIYYSPRDVVSGDFPYYYIKDDYIYVAAVDCTGHGVPGAMLSLIGFSVLNEILGHAEIYNAAEVLDLMHEGVVRTLKQDHSENMKTADGMDVALVRINKKDQEISFAGAHRPLYHVTDGELVSYKANRFPIGGMQYKKRTPFTNHTVSIKPTDSVYFCSDGLADQFGGPEDLKYGPKRIRERILENHTKPMDEISTMFDQEYQSWKGNGKQIDDLLMIGIRF